MPKKPPAPQKTKLQRVQDAVELLRNLQSVGIPDHDAGYLAIKAQIDQWVTHGLPWSGKIDLLRFGRYADIILPSRADRKCTMVLRATEELKEQIKAKEDP